MYPCNLSGPPAVTPGTSNARNAMDDGNTYDTPLFDLGRLVEEIHNGSATGLTAGPPSVQLPPPSSVHPVLQYLAPFDRQLCTLMSSATDRSGRHSEAEDLIARLEVPRRAVAQHAADTLLNGLYPDRSGPLDTEQLSQCIQHAGLVLMLSRLPVADLSQDQRGAIASVLIEIGAHAPTTARLLGLNPASLDTSNPVALCDRLMNEQALQTLENHAATPNQRAEAYSRVVLVGQRFGYPAEQPHWALATAPTECARTQVLRILTGPQVVLPTAPTDPISEEQIAQIAPDDARLCRLMSWSPPVPVSASAPRVNNRTKNRMDTFLSNTSEAQTLIKRTEPLRHKLAQRTADGLCDWLDADGHMRFAVHAAFLQNRIQSAGLARVLNLLPVQALPIAKRLGIGVLLRDVGAHTPTLRAHLRLEKHELQGIQPFMLRDRLMSLDRLEQLKGGSGRGPASRIQRGEAFWHATLVSKRFGYPADAPAWKLLVERKQDLPRANQLLELAKSKPIQRIQETGIKVQLP